MGAGWAAGGPARAHCMAVAGSPPTVLPPRAMTVQGAQVANPWQPGASPADLATTLGALEAGSSGLAGPSNSATITGGVPGGDLGHPASRLAPVVTGAPTGGGARPDDATLPHGDGIDGSAGASRWLTGVYATQPKAGSS